MLSEASLEQIKGLRGRFPNRESALLPSLWIAQREEGHITEQALEAIADLLGMEPADVTSRASFYTMFNLRPRGKYLIQICRNISCALMGAEPLIEYLRKRLGVDVGEVTDDGRFELMTAECLASCGTAPMMQINEEYYEELTPERVDEILDGLP